MLSLREFLVLEHKIEDNRQRVLKIVAEAIEQFRSDLHRLDETKIMTPSLIILEDVQELVDVDLRQNEQDAVSMNIFLAEFEALSDQEKMECVNKLAQPLPNSKFIENNNQVKLVLIYQNFKGTEIGNKAYEAVVVNKIGYFQSIAYKKQKSGELTADQAADYASEMIATFCGAGYYNSVNGGKYSLDAYDPYSGVPLNHFINQKIVNSSFNKLQANFNTSIAGDYVGSKDGLTNVVSTDQKTTNASSDDKDMTVIDGIEDESELGKDPSEILDKKEKLRLLEKALTGVGLPEEMRLTEKELIAFNEMNFKSKSLEELGRQLGYQNHPVPNVKRIQENALRKIKLAVEYLMKNEATNNQ